MTTSSASEVCIEDVNDPIDASDSTRLCESPDSDHSCRSSLAAGLEQTRGYIIEKTNKCFFIGSVLLCFGGLMYLNPWYDFNYFYLSLMLILVGGICVWIPVYCWMSEPSDVSESPTSNSQEIPEPIVPHVVRMKPPDYEALRPPPHQRYEAPPAYEDVFGASPHLQTEAVAHQSGAVCIDVPVCPVHEPRVEHLNTKEPGTGTLTRSRSMGDLYRTQR